MSNVQDAGIPGPRHAPLPGSGDRARQHPVPQLANLTSYVAVLVRWIEDAGRTPVEQTRGRPGADPGQTRSDPERPGADPA